MSVFQILRVDCCRRNTVAIFLSIAGQSHEIHPPSKDQPGIVVHICEDPEGYIPGGCNIPQTRCPERKT